MPDIARHAGSCPPLLVIRHLVVRFESRVILRDVSMTVPCQGVSVIMGPSGTGKSTLLRFLAGHLAGHPTASVSADIEYMGKAWPPAVPPALVEQKGRMLLSSVHENLVSELPGRSSLTRRQQELLISERLAQWGCESLTTMLGRPVVELPHPLQRAVCILRSALSGPSLLMVDEPTAGIGDKDAEMLWGVIDRVAESCPALVVSHHLAQTREHAQHIILLADGCVQEEADADTFFDFPKSEAARHFVISGSCPEGVFARADGNGPAAEPELSDEEISWAPETEGFMAKSASCGPNGFVWLIPGEVAGTPLPGIIRPLEVDLGLLRDVGINHLISLTEAPLDPGRPAGYGIDCSSFPIPDMHAPSMEQAVTLCRLIDDLRTQGGRVALHCKAGLGRTGTLLAAYWIWRGEGRTSALEAIRHIRGLSGGMIQSAVQEHFLNEFADEVTLLACGTSRAEGLAAKGPAGASSPVYP